MAKRAKGSEGQHGGRAEKRPLAFIDHHRQDYAEQVSVPCEGEFLIGDYRDEDGGVLVGELGEFKVQLHHLGDRRGTLDAQLCVFGDGVGALAVLFDLAGGDLGGLLSPVGDRDEFSRRLLDLGLRDASHAPLREDR